MVEYRSPLRNGPTRHQFYPRFLVKVILRLRLRRLFVRCFLPLRLLLEASLLPHGHLFCRALHKARKRERVRPPDEACQLHLSWSKAPVSWKSLLDLLSASGFRCWVSPTCRAELKI